MRPHRPSLWPALWSRLCTSLRYVNAPDVVGGVSLSVVSESHMTNVLSSWSQPATGLPTLSAMPNLSHFTAKRLQKMPKNIAQYALLGF